jgi:hypothetical protein
MEMIYKSVQDGYLDEHDGLGEREILCKASTDDVDQQGHVFLASGLVKKNYNQMPLYVGHNYKSGKMPIGTVRWLKSMDHYVKAKVYITDKTPLARDAYALAKEGILKGYSIGLRANDVFGGAPTAEEKKMYPGATFIARKWTPMELSMTAMPCNPNALQIAISKGLELETDEFTCNMLKSVGVELNQEGVAHARSLIHEGRIDRNTSWSVDAHDSNKELENHGGSWESYGRTHLGKDHTENPDTKAHWKYPVIKNGKVYIHGLRAAISRAAQNHETGIEDAARSLLAASESRRTVGEMVHHLAKHMK